MILVKFAHFVICIACLLGALEISRSYLALFKLRWRTRIAAKLFFVCVAVANLGFIIDKEGASFFQGVYVVEAIALSSFLVLLFIDLRKALKRLRLAFTAIQSHYGKDGQRMIATVVTALQGSRDDQSG
jgi:hypothetical protein